MQQRIWRVFTDGNYHNRFDDLVINWGSSHVPVWAQEDSHILNCPIRVSIAGNKLLTFQSLAANPAISLPEWTSDSEIARLWFIDGATLVARTSLTGHSGSGIVLMNGEVNSPFSQAPLYTKYIKKAAEYRVHVAFGKVIDVQQKRKRTDFDGEVNTQIRSHQNGWVYCREGIIEPTELRTQAILAVEVLGLDFGAVDIIYNRHHNKCYVLEVNTAPGLEGSTVEKYTSAFMEYINDRRE